jgi:hypothetical protein
MNDSEDTAQDVEGAEALEEESSTSEEVETGEIEETGETEDKPEKVKKTGIQKRVDQLTWKLREEERQRQELQAKLQQYEQRPPEPAKSVEFPTLESVDYDEGKFQVAVAKYWETQADTVLNRREQQRAEEAQQRELSEKISEFHAKGAKIADDYEELVTNNQSLPVTEAMRDALIAIDKGPEVLYHLASNPDDIFRIANLSPYAQAVEIGRLEARLSLPRSNKSSSAPPPVKPLTAGGESVSKNPDEMTTKQWLAWREKQLKG